MEALVDYAALTRLVREAIGVTVREIALAPGSRLLAYALLTDDNVAGFADVHYVASPTERMAGPRTGYADALDLRFRPYEWPTSGPVHPVVLAASEQFAHRARPDPGGADDDRAFDALVDALANARASGAFAPDVFLCVLCGDPSAESELRQYASIRRLNSPNLVREYHASLRTELVEVLADIETNPTERSEWRQADLVETMRRDIARLDSELGPA